MRPIRTFNVSPALPAKLEPLRTLAHNIYWDWNVEIKDLFRRLDEDLWESSRHNPVLMLGTISQERLQEVAEDEGFLAQMDRAVRQLDEYLKERTWYLKQRKNAHQAIAQSNGQDRSTKRECYAYFSAEFGLADCLPIYSGGLGILAGDHLKSASDLGLPLVGVGLLYQEGYFAQYLNADGWQQERYPINDFYNMPLHLERNAEGEELRIAVDYPGRKVYARVWRVQVGTVPLYLLDTNIEPNNPYDHDITDELYGGDIDMRIDQEIMLGIGGVQMLKALGYEPTVYHMNEGHSAFLSLERIRMMMQEEGLTFAEARTVAQASQVFTTHTPVPAGIDLFPSDKVMYSLGDRYVGIFGIGREEFLSLGRENTGDFNAPFSMAVLAIKMASYVNGVSQLHGHVSRQMFQSLWSDLPIDEVPITSITNGVHARSCASRTMQELYDRYLGPRWSDAPATHAVWERVSSIPDEELWRTHERCRSDLIMFVRERLSKHLRERGASSHELLLAEEALDPSALTIGFARRFATYKRATLFLTDLERIRKIIAGHNHSKKRLVQFVIAGKAHPKDIPGKELIRDIIHFARTDGMRTHIVFIPDYDIHVARLMVAGCDIWLNTPRRPHEASGTSGMKAAMNAVPNLSIPDGWWDEADQMRTGWSIGEGEMYDDPRYQDDVEANALYDLLEQEIVPMFYDRDEEDIPRKWVAKMKDIIRLNVPRFNTARMVGEYARQAYFPASDRYFNITANQYAPAKELAEWQRNIHEHWYNIHIDSIEVSEGAEIEVNQAITIKARLNLNGFRPEDVQFEIYKGPLDDQGQIVEGEVIPMQFEGKDETDRSVFTSTIAYRSSGLQGFSVRALPKHPNLGNPHALGLILWAQ